MLTLVLLITIAVPAFAATNDTESTEKRTVEDILGEYNQKRLTIEIAKETGNSTAYSNRGKSSDKTLEEETVDELRTAGYEAYNVTSSNYDSLEQRLNTNFEALGLNPNGSHIIVISSEEAQSDRTNPNARDGSNPEQDFIDDGGGSFLYYYAPHNRHYRMRYFWVTYNTVSKTSNIVSSQGTNYTNTLANSNITGSVTSDSDYTSSKTLGIFRNLWGLNTSATYSSPTLSVTCNVDWTRKFVDVYDESVSAWMTTTYYEYASTKSVFSGRYLNSRTASYSNISYSGYATIYSPHYGDDAYLKEQAVVFFSSLNPTYDRTHKIEVHATDQSGNTRILVAVDEYF